MTRNTGNLCSVSRTRTDRKRRYRAGLLLLALLVLAGCAGQPREPAVGTTDPGLAEASALSNAGRHGPAADAYLELARTASGPLAERYLIRAARERQLAGQLESAQAILDSLPDPVSEENLLGWAQVAGELAIARNQPEAALEAIAKAPRSMKPVAAAEIERLRAEAWFRLNDPVQGTEAMLAREVWLDDREAIAANQRLLWSLYSRFGTADAATIAQARDPVLAAWLELGQLAAAPSGGATGMTLALRNWQQQNPQHPANDALLPALLEELGSRALLADQVALLLPLSGRQQASGEAIRDGFMAAYYNSEARTRPAVRVYDVNAGGPVNTYAQAVSDGAQLVIGPLLKSNVQALATSPNGLSIPTLALNYLPEETPQPPGMVQFALAPEDEASEAADRAIAQGQRRAIALVPNNDWGRRLLNSFVSSYEGLGGVLVDYRLYEPSGRDFSYAIQELLLISESRDRETRLSANLRMDLGFEPRRRDDVDLIFLAARSQAGKLLRPQLRFYYAGGIPTYATSAIYQEDTPGNTDLNGILFPDMPWVVAPDTAMAATRASLATYWPGESKRRARLFAMGYDAFGLASRLTSPGGLAQMEGVTGRLYFGTDGRVHRRLAWAQIRNGSPRALAPLETPPTPPEQDADAVPR